MIKPEYKYSELTGKIIGCAMEAHNIMGNGFQEVIYQRALSLEYTLQNTAHLKAYNLEIGLLINFGNTKLEFHRLQNKKFSPSRSSSTSIKSKF